MKNSSFVAQSEEYPTVFKINLVRSNELEQHYSQVILGDSNPLQVKDALIQYVNKLIEPRDWKAVWRTTDQTFDWTQNVFDFEVEINDVELNSLNALVSIQKLLHPSLEEVSIPEKEKIEKMMEEKFIQAPLIQLYVINEPETTDQFSLTATVIEHVRFFYKHIWRPWDDVVVNKYSDLSFAESLLTDRLKLHFDLISGSLTKSVIERVRYLLEEGWRVKRKLDDLNLKLYQNNLDMDGPDKDDEMYVNEDNFYESLRLKMKLEDFELEMRRLEDPLLRSISMALKGNLENGQLVKIHILSNNFNVSILEKVSNYIKSKGQADSNLMFHNHLTRALKYCKSEDTLLILPGLYICDTLQWITSSLDVIGLGENCHQVVIQSNDYTGSAFIHCSGKNVNLINLTLRSDVESQGIITVHDGTTLIKNCSIDGGKCNSSFQAHLKIADCLIYHNCTLEDVGSIQSTFQKECTYSGHSKAT